jgi:hypothetical protein
VFKKRDAQESLLNSNNQFLDIVGRDTFYGFLSERAASMTGLLFLFAALWGTAAAGEAGKQE